MNNIINNIKLFVSITTTISSIMASDEIYSVNDIDARITNKRKIEDITDSMKANVDNGVVRNVYSIGKMNLLLEALKSFEEIPQNIEVEVLEITDSDLPEIVATNFVIPSVPSNSTESGNLGTSKFMSLINDPSILVIDKAWLCVGVLKYQEFVERDGFAAAATSMLLLADASIDANNKAMLCLGLLKYPAFVPLHGSAAAAVATPLLSNSSVDKINKAHLCYLILHYSTLAPYHNAAAAASMPLLIDYSINNVIKKDIKNLLKKYIKKIKVK